MLFPVKQNEEAILTDETLETLMQEEWLSEMGYLKEEYQKIPVPEQAQEAIQKGIQRAKEETEKVNRNVLFRKQKNKRYGSLAAFATLAATVCLFVLLQTNTQFAVSMAGIPVLKPVVEWMTGQEYHKDVYMDVKVAHLTGQIGNGLQDAIPLVELFEQDSDYVAVISAEIQRQLQQTEQKSELQPQFYEIAPNQCYYIDVDGNLVIVLEEYEMKPEFTIGTDVIASILK